MSFEGVISAFADDIASGEVEIYNEFSLQHELGIHLRNHFPQKKVQFERNVSFFGFDKKKFVKKEIDIAIFDSTDSNPKTAIELKYPRNGQIPEQMFSFCKDIAFAEQLRFVGFSEAYVVIFADDRLFYEGRQQDDIYAYFRSGKVLTNAIRKPTGSKDEEIYLHGVYKVKWVPVSGPLKYSIIEAQ